MKGERAEANSTRERILKEIGSNPGIGPSELTERTGINLGTLRYHLDLLESQGLISSSRSGKGKGFFLRDPGKRHRTEGGKSPLKERRVLALVRSEGPITRNGLFASVDITSPGLTYVLRSLKNKGLITTRIEDGQILYEAIGEERMLDEMLLELIDRYLKGELDEERFLRMRNEIRRRRSGPH